ncbi:prenyltransferase [candidate division FCPU426 bacterium]|nr:prenyltransferase [candidate division FCPU426 bacterium]
MRYADFIKTWFTQIRAPFLLLAVVLTMVGGAAAGRDGQFHSGRFLLTMLGVVLAHMAVNLFNEHADHRTGIDRCTRRTPFSGGSGNIQQGRTRPGEVLTAAWTTLIAAFAIGCYLAWISNGWILALMLAGGVTAVYYTSHFARWTLGELLAGVNLGTLVVIGAYMVQTGVLTGAVVWLSLPPGILTALLLLLNEFPDADADRQGGRRHLVIRLGWQKAALLYAGGMGLQYFLLIFGVWMKWLPAGMWLALATLPLAVLAAYRALRFGNRHDKMLIALGANVSVVLGTNVIIAVAYIC